MKADRSRLSACTGSFAIPASFQGASPLPLRSRWPLGRSWHEQVGFGRRWRAGVVVSSPKRRGGRRSRLGASRPGATRPAAGSSTMFQPCGCACPLLAPLRGRCAVLGALGGDDGAWGSDIRIWRQGQRCGAQRREGGRTVPRLALRRGDRACNPGHPLLQKECRLGASLQSNLFWSQSSTSASTHPTLAGPRCTRLGNCPALSNRPTCCGEYRTSSLS